MKPKKFEVLADVPAVESTGRRAFVKGETVFAFLGCDYGLANDDERITGEPYRSVTLDPEGRPPSHTIACRHLREVAP